MNRKLIVRLSIDLAMTILLLTAFAYQTIGGLAHELVGTAMVALFITHTVLNRKWYKNLFKGKYQLRRTLGTVVNLMLLGDMLVLIVSALMLSRNVFAFLHLSGSYQIVQIHTTAAIWARALVFVHLALHLNMIVASLKKLVKKRHTKTQQAMLAVMKGIN